uniref:DUF1618 domain-containing protein n=1 Tax=Oryza sativa subsp. indica TaxID=39946 RepID=A0A0P0YKA3_ORYSI|nr:hypothetical protein [Oryza sativa Indica Group]
MEAHGWMVLDRIVRCWSDDDDVVGGDDDPTASEVAYTCSGHPIRVSLRVADPPAVSRLYVHRPGWPRVYDLGDAEAIAAHRGSILLSARVPFADLGTVAPGQFPVDYYVYTAGEGLRRPSLTRLPPCFIGGFSSPEVDRHFKPHRCQQQRVMVEQNVGFFCHGAGNFTVADINIHKGKAVELCVLNHYADCPQQPQWKVQILEMQQQPNQNHHLRGWWTDAVLPLHDSYLACVDCYHGIILIDVKTQRYFNYIPLPAEAKHGRRRVDKYSPDPARSASINSAGNITVVCMPTTMPQQEAATTTALLALLSSRSSHGVWSTSTKVDGFLISPWKPASSGIFALLQTSHSFHMRRRQGQQLPPRGQGQWSLLDD